MRRPFRDRVRRPQAAVLAAGTVGSLALALSTTGTLSAFTASITNSTNTAASGYIAMKETLLDSSGNATSTTCSSNDGSTGSIGTNSATCATINKYGGTANVLVAGGAPHVTKINLTNTGTVPASAFALSNGGCTASAAAAANGGAATSAVCGKFTVSIVSGSKTLYSGTAAAMPTSINLLSALGQTSVAAGASVPVTISVAIDSSADNTYQGFQISQPLTWTFNA